MKTTPKLSEGLAVFPARGGKISSCVYFLFLKTSGVQRHKFQRQTSFPHCSAVFGAKPWGQVCPLPAESCWAQGGEEPAVGTQPQHTLFLGQSRPQKMETAV